MLHLWLHGCVIVTRERRVACYPWPGRYIYINCHFIFTNLRRGFPEELRDEVGVAEEGLLQL